MKAEERIAHMYTYANAVCQMIAAGIVKPGFAQSDLTAQLSVGMLATVVGEDAHQLLRRGGTSTYGLTPRNLRRLAGIRNGFAHEYADDVWTDRETAVLELIPQVATECESFLVRSGIVPQRMNIAANDPTIRPISHSELEELRRRYGTA